jgi:two-component system, chemotaxis family, chemotaxis protein CheY
VTGRPYPETVLVVDDTEFMVKMLEEIFTGAGYRVCTARSGEEAARIYEEELPDLVTLDIVMPGMDGIATLARLREIDPACRVVMVSAVGLEAKISEALRGGARNYVLKPFDRDKVLEAARKVLDEY